MFDLRKNLHEEIAFWRELIEACELDIDSQEYRRMKNALSLARRRLAEYEKRLNGTVGQSVKH